MRDKALGCGRVAFFELNFDKEGYFERNDKNYM